jgi:hypothetical protein
VDSWALTTPKPQADPVGKGERAVNDRRVGEFLLLTVSDSGLCYYD